MAISTLDVTSVSKINLFGAVHRVPRLEEAVEAGQQEPPLVFTRTWFTSDEDADVRLFDRPSARSAQCQNGCLPAFTDPSRNFGNVVLDLSPSQYLGQGQTGVVYGVASSPGSSAYSSFATSSLAVKIAHDRGRVLLAREARLYDDMQSLQGSVIPFCYGYFEASMPENGKFTQLLEELNVISDDLEDLEESVIYKPGRIGVLLLQRLSSEGLPIGREFSTEERVDISALYREICQLQVKYNDYRYHNILQVLPSTPEVPMPHSQRVSSYRIIDFGSATRTTEDPDELYKDEAEHWSGRILDDAQDGVKFAGTY